MRLRRTTDSIIVHCTATTEGRDFNLETIRRWHKSRGFADIGYHYIVHLDGRIEEGRNCAYVGAHCQGKNETSIGIAYVGGCATDGRTPKDTRTEAQRKALADLITKLRGRYGNIPVYGHRDFSSKACPCFDARKEYN